MLINKEMLSFTKGLRKIILLTSFVQFALFSLAVLSALSIAQTINLISKGTYDIKWFILLAVSTLFACGLKPVYSLVQTKCSNAIKTKLREDYG